MSKNDAVDLGDESWYHATCLRKKEERRCCNMLPVLYFGLNGSRNMEHSSLAFRVQFRLLNERSCVPSNLLAVEQAKPARTRFKRSPPITRKNCVRALIQWNVKPWSIQVGKSGQGSGKNVPDRRLPSNKNTSIIKWKGLKCSTAYLRCAAVLSSLCNPSLSSKPAAMSIAPM